MTRLEQLIAHYEESLAKLADVATHIGALETLLQKAIARDGYSSFKTSNYIVTDAVRDIRKTRGELMNFSVDDYATLKRILVASGANPNDDAGSGDAEGSG